MELKINVDETMFKKVLEKELEAFSQQEIHDIIRAAFTQYFQQEGIIKALFIEEDYNRYGCKKENPTQLLLDAANNFNLAPAFEEIQNKMIQELKDNYKDVLQSILLKMISEGLCSSYSFHERVNETVHEILSRRSE